MGILVGGLGLWELGPVTLGTVRVGKGECKIGNGK